MSQNRFVYSRAFIKSLRPTMCNSVRSKRKHHGGWQHVLKRINIYQMSVPEILSFNCRSLIGKVDYLQFLLSLNIYRNCNLITFQESWLHELCYDNLISLNSFKIFCQDRSVIKKKCGGGVATFVNTNWCVCFKFSNDFVDCLTLRCRPKYLNKYEYIYVTIVYVTPDFTSSVLSHFADEFTEFAVTTLSGSLSVVCGDFISSDCTFLSSLSHQNLVHFPTRYNVMLDLVFVNDIGIYETRKRTPLLNSDHCIIRVLPKIYAKSLKNTTSCPTRKIKYRNYSDENIYKLINMLESTNWNLFTNESLETTVDVTSSYLKFCLDACCPNETIIIRFDRLISPHLKRLRREKESHFRNKDYIEVRRLNGSICQEIKRLKALYAEKLLSCKKSFTVWKLFKELTHTKQITEDTHLNACSLNQFFIRHGSDKMLLDHCKLNKYCGSIFTEIEVLECLKALKPSRCPGPD
ncbi:hypothetical protein MN116_000079 [Schistosoma mekongi]|uniref:Endonuclease/exonuclease/phosphatase domain-containing protein n=1 Tax=Schistosoma mekongi TaxID=38744 RepID=A0AAE1ZA24_SCHME|nr:hypothetical protein MN116_000079 [Schistosoma mekongi]